MESFGEQYSDVKYHSGYSKNLVDKVKLGLFLDKLIFEDNDIRIFNILDKSDKLFKYKYDDGELLVDKVIRVFQDSLFKDVSKSSYYSRVIFDILKKPEYRTNKAKLVLDCLRNFKSKMNNSDSAKIVSNLINELTILCEDSLSVISRDNYQTLLLRNYGIKNGFSRYIESEKNLKFPDARKVVDLRDKNVITMDHKFKVAYDDAISVERLRNGNYLLGVYITDVSSFVGMDTVLYEDARQRGESIYGDQKNKFYLPMFPREMTKNFFSLNQGEDKYVIAHFFEFSSSFDFIGYEQCRYFNALVNIKKNYSFDKINRMNTTDSNYDMIYTLKRITESLCCEFSSEYHSIKEKIKKNKVYYDSGLGSNIISSVTILLNTTIAKMMDSYGFPYIYRINDSDISTSLIGDANLEKIIKGSSISSYSVNPKGHPVNGYLPYGHITNPMRNFASYMNQYIFNNTVLEYQESHNFGNVLDFNKKISDILPGIVSDLNHRLDLNEKFLDVYSELDGNGLCDYKKYKKTKGKNGKNMLTKRR